MIKNTQYTEMPETSNSDKEYRAAASVSARSDGKMCYATNAYYRDGDFVASGGISNSLFKGIEILKDATSSFFSANEELTQESAENFEDTSGIEEESSHGEESEKTKKTEETKKSKGTKPKEKKSSHQRAGKPAVQELKEKEKSDLPDHLIKFYKEVEEKVEAMLISDDAKDQIKERMYSNLKKVASNQEPGYHLQDLFSFRDSPNIWYLNNFVFKEDENVRRAKSLIKYAEFKNIIAKEIEQEQKKEAAKSPQIKEQEAALLDAENKAFIKEQIYLLNKHMQAVDKKNSYITYALIDYVVDKMEGKMTIEAIEALGVLGFIELSYVYGLLIVYDIATFGDDEKEFIEKIRTKGNYYMNQ